MRVLKQIGLGMHNYHDTFKTLPMGFTNDYGLAEDYVGQSYAHHTTSPPERYRGSWAWSAYIAPFMELGPQHDILDVSHKFAAESLVNAAAVDVIQTPVATLRCPSDTGQDLNDAGGEYRPSDLNDTRHQAATSNYAGVCDGNSTNIDNRQQRCDGVLFVDSNIRFGDVIDGTSNVLMVGERCRERHHARCGVMQNCGAALVFVIATSNQLSHRNRGNCAAVGSAYRGINWDSGQACNNLWDAKSSFHSLHPGGAQFVLVDGSAHFLSETIDLTTIRRLGNRRDRTPAMVP